MTIDIYSFQLPDVCVENWHDLKSDEQRFLQLYDQVNGRFYSPYESMPSRDVNEALDNLLDQDCYAAYDNEENIISVGACYPDGKESRLWVSAISVAEEYQGRGVGSGMLRHLEKIARQKEGIAQVALRSVFTAEGFYEKNGYSPISSDRVGLLTQYEKKIQ